MNQPTDRVGEGQAGPSASEGRIETGPLQIGDDWPGTFIRGDNAFGFAMALEALLAVVKAELSMEGGVWLDVAQCEGLLGDLRSSQVKSGTDPGGLQRVPTAAALRASEAALRLSKSRVSELEAGLDRTEDARNTAEAALAEAKADYDALWGIAAKLKSDWEASRAEATKAERREAVLVAAGAWAKARDAGEDPIDAYAAVMDALHARDDAAIRAPQPPEPYCAWCEAFRERKKGCHGRAGWHHHTTVLVAPGTINVIAGDDCPIPDAPSSPPPPSEEPRHRAWCRESWGGNQKCECAHVPSPSPTRQEPR